MVDHTIEAHFTVNSSAVAGQQSVHDMVTTRMANAVLGGTLGADPERDAEAKRHAAEVYVMVLTMMQALSELGIGK